MAAVASFSTFLHSGPPSSSAAGVISYLDEDDVKLQTRALEKIYTIIDVHWAEICESLPKIEALSEDPDFPAADLAAAVASKCFYHLQDYNDALRLALSAGKYLNIHEKNEYIECILTKCIDEYKSLRSKAMHEDSVVIDPRMETIIEQMFQRCYRDSCFEQALGVALDTQRIDKVEECITKAINASYEVILSYAFNLCQSARRVTPREFRLEVINVLVNAYSRLPVPDYSNVVFAYIYLNKPREAAEVINKLLLGSDDDALSAYQIAFDLQETENQGFIVNMMSHLTQLSAPLAGISTATAEPSTNEEQRQRYTDRVQKITRICAKGLDIDLILHFLFKSCHSDPNILKEIKTAIEGRSNVLHNATIMAHAYLYNGTTRDGFLRENLDWLGKAKNWSKFTTVASIGVVHKGHIHESMTLLQPYLPQGGTSASPFSEAGALYALGLIHANKGGMGDSATITYLADALRNAGEKEVVQHGACLGIGLAAMATGDEGLFEALKGVLFMDSAIGGEGAALGIGLLMLGQCDSPLAQQALPELLNYLHDTQHEKIIRALALAVAMMVYGKEESADVLIETLSRDRDPIVRYGGMWAVAMAYCGTGENRYLRKLLHVAVSDVNDDVRRAAVMAIGFVMCGQGALVPRTVQLLAESFNPHVRYGAAMAIGIACAGSGQRDAVDLLSSLLEDPTDFVRNGAMLALAMVLQQCAEQRLPVVRKFKDHLMQVIQEKHQPIIAKSGAILAVGILDAGGGNVVVNMQSRVGFMKMAGAVGMLLFLQHWYWYPLLPFLSLSFSPTFLLALNGDFHLPASFEMICNAPPSLFAYPKAEEKKEEDKKLVATAVLSTTAKAKAREARKEAKKLGRQMSVEGEGPALERVHSHLSTTSYLSLDAEKPAVLEIKAKKPKEPTSFAITNPSRVVPAQLRYLSTLPDHRYSMVGRGPPMGIVMVRDKHPDQPEDLVKVDTAMLTQEEDAEPFEPFDWNPNDE